MGPKHTGKADITLSSPPPTSAKPKKEKSSKKRKASKLTTSVPDVETIVAPTSTSSPLSELNTADDHEVEPPTKKRKSSVEEIEVDITAPEPPSKKALRRLKKGKPLPPSKSGAETTPEPDAKKDKKSEVEKRSEHGVWIGNLPWTVSKEALRKFLVEYSDLTEEVITRVHMPGPDDKKSANKVEERKFGKPQHNKGFAYVDFSTPDAVDLAIELSEQLLSGRRVLIKNAKSFEGRPKKTKEEIRSDGKPPSKKIFVGNLSFDTTEESLREHFERCGAIESLMVASFQDSGKCKGYAWITFEEIESAQHAVRGFVHVKEEDSEVSESESAIDSDDEITEIKPKKVKMRRQWVNEIKGRRMRMEFAEDAQVRYKKRYGKEGTKRTQDGGAVEASGEDAALPTKPVSKAINYDLPYGGPRLTGGIVEGTGKKTTF
jgi:RNA recognition motif-containing protein